VAFGQEQYEVGHIGLINTIYTNRTDRDSSCKAMDACLDSACEAMRTASGGVVDFTAVFTLHIREPGALSNCKATRADKEAM
jgi:hypothetical protein